MNKVLDSVRKRSLELFFESFYLTNQRFDECYAQELSPSLKNSSLCAYSWFLSNMLSLVISFVYFANIALKLYTFCISPAQHNNISKQQSTRRCFNIIVLLCTAEIDRVQNLMRTLARTSFKSISSLI